MPQSGGCILMNIIAKFVEVGAMNSHAHHLDRDWILERAAGTLDPCLELVVDAHAELCAQCGEDLKRAQQIGLEIISAMDGRRYQLDYNVVSSACEHDDDVMLLEEKLPIPNVVQRFCAESDSRQRRLGPLEETVLLESANGYKARLLKIHAGARIPSHTHEGEEVTLVLHGGYTDGNMHFGPGDISLADERIDHAPVADPDGPCYVLAVNVGRIKLTGVIGRHFNPFVRF